MERVVAYIDGYNLYYGLRSSGWRRYYWLNPQTMAGQLLRPDQALVLTRYFTTIVKQPDDQRRRQALFLEALGTLPDISFHYGHYLSSPVTCRNCGHTVDVPHEKMTDVNIAVEMMSDAYRDSFDVALLVTADSDLVGPVKAIHHLFPDKRVLPVFPPNRWSSALKTAAGGSLHITRSILAKSQMPDEVTKPDGYVLRRPALWR
jgi:hypothetical protein